MDQVLPTENIGKKIGKMIPNPRLRPELLLSSTVGPVLSPEDLRLLIRTMRRREEAKRRARILCRRRTNPN